MPGKIYSNELGIDVKSKDDNALFRWLVACLLFGRPIQQEIAAGTFRELEKDGLLESPEKLQQATWQHIVDVLNRGHYKRYDESTATRLLDMATFLQEKYDGSMRRLVEDSENKQEIQKRLQEFNGIGPKASSIFLRDLPEA